MATLCETFRSIAFNTYERLMAAKSIDYQPLEETFTDNIMLDLKLKHPVEIFTRPFNKRVEGVNGADWEWWLTNAAEDNWLGLRVQAKILNFKPNEYSHLHHKVGKAKKAYQLANLKRESAKAGMVPLYCFYSYGDITSAACGSFGHAAEAFGCSLTSLAHVESLQAAGEKKGFDDVMEKASPWHCLVCCSGFGPGDLPTRAWNFLQGSLDIKLPKPRKPRQSKVDDVSRALPSKPAIGPRGQPPHYVRAIVGGEAVRPDQVPKKVAGVIVIKGYADTSIGPGQHR